jgi:hypothetical protein
MQISLTGVVLPLFQLFRQEYKSNLFACCTYSGYNILKSEKCKKGSKFTIHFNMVFYPGKRILYRVRIYTSFLQNTRF